MKKLSIVVPCYNEQETIYPFLEATQKVEQQMKDQLIFDYIFVNDGSKDDTLTIYEMLLSVLTMYIICHFHVILGKKQDYWQVLRLLMGTLLL